MDSKLYDPQLLSSLIEYNHRKYIAFRDNLPFIPNPALDKLLNARHQKQYRIRRKLVYLLARYKYIWFCTFTFSNRNIIKTSRTKRDYIKQVIGTHDFKYILNIDFGSKGQREHYHCILASNVDLDVNQYIQSHYLGGFCLAIQCKTSIDDFERLLKYISKLVNHCIKATTPKQRIVYNFKGYSGLSPSFREQNVFYLLDLKKISSSPT